MFFFCVKTLSFYFLFQLFDWHIQLDKSLPAPLGTIGAWLYRAEVALREEITIQQVHEETANTIQRKREQHKVNTLAGKPSSVTVLVLPNQVCLPITQRVKG